MKIDNFALSMHETCPAKYDLRIRGRWTSRQKSPALGAGGALHEGLAEWYKSGSLEAAQAAITDSWDHTIPVDDWRTVEKVRRTMADYVKRYPKEPWEVVGANDGAPIIEKSFTLHTGMYLPCGLSYLGEVSGVAHSGNRSLNRRASGSGWSRWRAKEPEAVEEVDESGLEVELQEPDQRCPFFDPPPIGEVVCENCGRSLEPIEYGGIIDLMAGWSGGIYVVDHKTTSRLGSTYFLQFKPDNQMTGYTWGAEGLTNLNVSGVIINAIGWYKTQATKFERELTTRGEDDIGRWLAHLQIKCIGLKMHERFGVWPQNSSACTLYGLCEYHRVHSITVDKVQRRLLEQEYVQSEWDYENRDGGA